MDNNNITDINSLTNINALCRVCLIEDKEMTSLNANYDNKINSSKIWQILHKLTNVKIFLDERFPSQICSLCMEQIRDFCQFKLKFENSQKILSTYFEEDLIEKDNFISMIELVQDKSEVVPVELISKQGKFDLKDVVIVEDSEEETSNFDGFLNILGKEVSVSFVEDKPLLNVNSSNFCITKDDIPIDNIKCAESNSIDSIVRASSDTEDVNTNVQAPKEPKRCAICNKIFNTKSRLQAHINVKHLNIKQKFICEICGITLNSKSSHYYHMVKHGDKSYTCNFCHKSFSHASALQLHISAVHKNTRTHLCTICGKQFNYSNALKYHMRIHMNEKKYKCIYCDKAFRMQCGLDRHLRTHTGIRPYKCNYCEKALRSKGELDCHEMTHTGYRPYHCKYCNKGFTKTYNLKLHLLSHKGQHICTVCNRTFIELQFLQIHMQSSHSSNGIINEDI